MILVPLEQLYTSRDSIRKAREALVIHRGNRLEPAGFNRTDECNFTWFILFCILIYLIIIIIFSFHFHYLGYTLFPFLLILHIPWLCHVISNKYKDFVTKIFIQINLLQNDI